jgi:hypothetical protein
MIFKLIEVVIAKQGQGRSQGLEQGWVHGWVHGWAQGHLPCMKFLFIFGPKVKNYNDFNLFQNFGLLKILYLDYKVITNL